MNSPLENRKVRLRGLGGPALRSVPGTGASAAGRDGGIGLAETQSAQADFVPFQPRFQSPGRDAGMAQ